MTATSTTTSRSVGRIRMVIVGIIVPLLIAAAGIVAIISVIPTLPDPIAVHWGISGEPDGFGTPIGSLILIAVTVLAYSALAFGFARGDGPIRANQRILVATAPFLATIVTVIGAGSVVMQAGVQDARDAPSVLPLVAGAAIGGVLLGILALVVLPAAEPVETPDPATLPTVELSDTQKATWMQRLTPSRTVGAVLAVAALLTFVGGGLVLWVSAPIGIFAAYLAGVAVIGLLVASTLSWRVTVDGRGFIARSVLGLPAFRVPLDQVQAATTIEVDPTRDFGGWGIRWGGRRRTGIVLRRGEAIEVLRRDGRALVVTVPQSERGAALLNSLAKRA